MEVHLEKMERFKQYEDEYTRRLMAKYFSKKNLYGGNIFDENAIIDDELIKSSRWPCTRSFADPVQAFEDHSSNNSATISETPLINSNGNHQPKKNGPTQALMRYLSVSTSDLSSVAERATPLESQPLPKLD